MSIKTFFLAALGAMLLVLLVVLWGVFSGRITLLIQSGLCSLVGGPPDCRLRGAHLFVLWAVIGLVVLVTVGLLVDRFNGRS